MLIRCAITISGAVQGVGFRPFIYRLAADLSLTGFIQNTAYGVYIEVEGIKEKLDLFLMKINSDKPKNSFISAIETSVLSPIGFTDFEIRNSSHSAEISAIILPDMAVCPDCLEEMWNPENRRYLYPFINCTNCGPRFSIIEALPYDRCNTTMDSFQMCEECLNEYEDINDRRYHAQPIACPVCGPKIELLDNSGKIISKGSECIIECANLILAGNIIAFKGIGGFQLLADARNYDVISKLRKRKHREEKPFALMFPDIDSVKEVCEVSIIEERILESCESPIVLLKRKENTSLFKIADNAAHENPYLGVMLPYSPLHHLLMKTLKIPIVATSGNFSDEPICIDNNEAIDRLDGIADFFLVHNRPIARHIDDSIVRVVKGREMMLRRARGYAPLPYVSDEKNEKILLAVGAHQKNSIALKKGESIFISQHIGDLSTNESYNAFNKVINDFKTLYNAKPDYIIHDLHPDYLSTKYVENSGIKTFSVQHHIAHVLSCRFENKVKGKALGVAWDGTGYGLDGTIWGGEFFLSEEESIMHIGQFKQFRLPGGDFAVTEPRRAAIGLLYEQYGDRIFEYVSFDFLKYFSANEIPIFRKMLRNNINSPLCSSVGRLFDALSSLLELCQRSTYEGQAAMKLEFIADINIQDSYGFHIYQDDILTVDWQIMINEIFKDIKNKVQKSIISGKFHNTLSKIILSIAEMTNSKQVILSGGCFQNVLLLEKTINLLESNNFHVFYHQRVPPNDGGIALGQIAAFLQLNH